MTIFDVAEIISDCSFNEYEFHCASDGGRMYLYAVYDESDTVTGVLERQVTRHWIVDPDSTKSAVVATAFKCAMTSMEHRTREWFLYRNRAIYQPHYDVDQLHAICEERAHA